MRHPGSVSAIAISADGSAAYSAGQSGTIACWALQTGEKTAELKGHGEAVNGLAISPVEDRLVTASQDTTLLIWRVRGAL